MLCDSLFNRYNELMSKIFKKIDQFLDRHTILWLALLLLTVLRIPNFFDPYWYGDEAIYLTVGQSIRSGKKLYTEIVDHKTPIIYYLAAVPNQFWFRILLLTWMIATTAAFYAFSRKLFKNKTLSALSTFAFVLLTTLPWFEGHIPNGELFVMGFILVGLWLMTNSSYLQPVLESNQTDKLNFKYLLAGGAFFGLGILTKVPALLDLAAVMTIAWFSFTRSLGKNFRKWQQKLLSLIRKLVPLLLGVFIPILISILYFVLRGSGQDYLRFGLLYNLHYTQNWTLDLGSKILNFVFSMPSKTLILFVLIFALSLIKKLSDRAKFLLSWVLTALYSVLLSSRPYPHYVMQIVPPLVLTGTMIVANIVSLVREKQKLAKNILAIAVSTLILIMSTLALITLDFRGYGLVAYYQNFYQFVTGKISQQKYYQSFNYLMDDNYALSQFLQKQGEHKLFIWGDNPMLYALSQTIPASRFTVAFHITDLGVYDKTLEEIKQVQPKFIVVMNDAPNNFHGFYSYLNQNYIPNSTYEHMVLYKQQNQ